MMSSVSAPRPALAPAPAEIRTTIQQARAAGPSYLPGDVEDLVRSIVPRDWQITVEHDTTRQHVARVKVDVGTTFYQLCVEPASRAGDICLMRSTWANGKQTARSILEFCKTEEELKDFFDNAMARIEFWETTVTPFLEEQTTVEKNNDSEFVMNLADNVVIRIVPSFFPNCACMLLRGQKLQPRGFLARSLGFKPKRKEFPRDFVAQDLEMLEVMIKRFEINQWAVPI